MAPSHARYGQAERIGVAANRSATVVVVRNADPPQRRCGSRRFQRSRLGALGPRDDTSHRSGMTDRVDAVTLAYRLCTPAQRT